MRTKRTTPLHHHRRRVNAATAAVVLTAIALTGCSTEQAEDSSNEETSQEAQSSPQDTPSSPEDTEEAEFPDLAAPFPELPQDPEAGTWYGVYPEGAQSALGEQYHGNVKIGTTGNVLVLFNGGGASIDANTAADPETYYTTDTGGDGLAYLGLGGGINPDDPFADWTVINLLYNTADFHVGQGDFTFQGPEGNQNTIHHVGLTNFDLVMEQVRPLLDEPDKLLITGYSAGGFGAALLADHVMESFPEAQDVTVAVDSALIVSDRWPTIARDVWQAPAKITDRLTSDNPTLDALTALTSDHPDVKVLFSSSTRDGALVENHALLNNGQSEKTKAGADRYQQELTTFVEELRDAAPNVAFYIFEGMVEPGEMGLTQHTMLLYNSFDPALAEMTPADWIYDGVQGNLHDLGLDLLQQ